ncbi:MAG: ADP-ribosylglycohydrolase family protein [Alphaproteobacteria bacterium]
MLGAIAGDIVGSRFEGAPAPAHGFDLFHPDCRFTDDTVCTLAVAAARLDGTDYAATLRRFVRRHPQRGYGALFQRWAAADAAPAYGSWGNGAPMRTVAIGWLAASATEARREAAAQAAVTHDHPDAVAAAEATALAIHLARAAVPTARIAAQLENAFGYDLAPRRVLTTAFDISAKGTVQPALAAALHAEDWETAVRAAVSLGGDTDTLACIAGGVAEAIHGLPVAVAATARRYLSPDLQAVLDRFTAALAAGGAVAAAPPAGGR